jgi:hypothetical protein
MGTRQRAQRLIVLPAVLLLLLGAATRLGSQSSDWSQFHAATPDERREDKLWDKESRRLKPGEVLQYLIEMDMLPGVEIYSDAVKRWTCASDQVVIGTPVSSKALLTSSEASIFTDYRVAVNEWLRGAPDAAKPVVRPTTLVVSLGGGRIATADGVIEVAYYPPLEIGTQFILFAARLPNASSFALKGPPLAVGKTIRAPTQWFRIPSDLAKGDKAASDVLADIKSASTRCAK